MPAYLGCLRTNGAYHRLLTLVESINPHGDAARRLADINRVAESELRQ